MVEFSTRLEDKERLKEIGHTRGSLQNEVWRSDPTFLKISSTNYLKNHSL